MSEFDWQTEWREFKQEYREDTRLTRDGMDDIRTRLGMQETRITILEGGYKAVRWFVALIVTAIVGTIAAMVKRV